MNKMTIQILLQIAFEIGRNYEQIYLSLDLYNIINFDDLIFAKEKGTQIENINIDFENIFKSKIFTGIEKRKFKRLLELKNKLNNLMDKL